MAKKPDEKKTKKGAPIEKEPEEIIQKSMEAVMHDSMMPYSEYIILERALPRVEDGLKLVQRRILYTMMELGNTPDKPHRKCARIVGDCLGKYHPHGDSSVYDALTRMAQSFVMRSPLVDGHGNFGSVDGDSPAAMRYTEARMTEQAMLLLRDIEKDTVGYHLNFDDSLKEPDLLPGRFPNLLVNGAMGIAIGLATNIPPHNMGEVIDGVIAQIDDPKITTAGLMKYIKAPDFPTGGVLAAGDGELVQAYETGRGKLQVRAKVHIEDGSAGRKLIVVDEIPYQVNKAAMLEKILHLSEEKKSLFSGIYDIRDESDRMGMRAVVELRKEANVEATLNALYKYSDMQTTYGVNIVAIADGKPMQMGLKTVIAYYIKHQKDVVTRRTKYDLAQAEARAHILEGLIIAVDNLDEVIRIIRSSKTPKEARERLMQRFALDEIQAQAILDMRLQRLTNLEVLSLKKEYADLQKLISQLKAILASEKKLMNVIKKELQEVREQFADARRTEIVDTFDKIVIEEEKPVADETVVAYTRGGFLKRMQPKAFEKALLEEQSDPVLWKLPVMTDDKLVFFTDAGNCYPLTAEQVPEARPKDRGIAPGGLLAGLEVGENVIAMRAFSDQGDWVFVTRKGQVKRIEKKDCAVRKNRFSVLSLKEDDKLLSVLEPSDGENALLISEKGQALNFALSEVSAQGRSAAGVKGMAVAEDDTVLFAFAHASEGEVILATELGILKRCLLIDFDRQARGGKGARCFPFTKKSTFGTRIAGALIVKEPYDFDILQKRSPLMTVNSEAVPIETKTGKGTQFTVAAAGDEVTALIKKLP